MYKLNRDSQTKAVRLAGGGTTSLRKHREDGGGTGNAGAAGAGSTDPLPMAPPPPLPPPPAVKAPDDKLVAGKLPDPMLAKSDMGPKPLNSQAVLRRGGKTR